jgi:hypothetical protein
VDSVLSLFLYLAGLLAVIERRTITMQCLTSAYSCAEIENSNLAVRAERLEDRRAHHCEFVYLGFRPQITVILFQWLVL